MHNAGWEKYVGECQYEKGVVLCQCPYCLVLVHQRVKPANEEPELSHRADAQGLQSKGEIFFSPVLHIFHSHSFCLFSASME